MDAGTDAYRLAVAVTQRRPHFRALARELKIPLDPVAAARVLVTGHTRAIDVGLLTVPGERPRYFCEMVGIGFDAALMHGILPEMKMVLGKGAFVVSAVTTSFTHRPTRLRLVIDGKRVIDLGGTHTAQEARVDLDTLGLVRGRTYPLDFFFAERHTVDSNLLIETSIVFSEFEAPR